MTRTFGKRNRNARRAARSAFRHWQSPNSLHPHQVQPNCLDGGSFIKVCTGELTKRERKKNEIIASLEEWEWGA